VIPRLLFLLPALLLLCSANALPQAVPATPQWRELHVRALELSNQGRLHEAAETARKARKLAEADQGKDSEAYMAIALREAGIRADLGQLDAASALLEEVRNILGDPQGRPLISARLALAAYDLERKRGNFHAALAHARHALSVYQSREEVPYYLLAETRNRIALALEKLGRYDEARRQYEQAIAIAREHDDLAAQRLLHHNLGTLFYDQGLLDRAEQYYTEAVALARAGVNATGQDTSDSYANLARVLLDQGRGREALPLLDEALALVSRNGILNTPRGLRVLSHLCFTLNDLGRHHQATTYCRKAATVARPLGPKPQVEPLLYLASAYASLGQHLRAQRIFKRALKLAKQAGDPDTLAHAHYTIGLAQVRARQFQTARQHLQQALDTLPANARPTTRATVLGTLGQALLHDGQPRKAAELLQQALDIEARFIPGSSSYLDTLFILAEAHHALGHKNEARRLYQQALTLARRLGKQPTLAAARDNLRRLDNGQPPRLVRKTGQ